MYNFLFAAQIVAVLLSFICIVMIMIQRNSGIAKYMILTCICAFIQNAGYLQEMRSRNVDEAMMAVSFEYIGTAMILVCMFAFTLRYCKYNFPKLLRAFLLFISAITVISVWTYEINGIYYSGVSWSEEGILPHLVLDKGPLYIIFSITVFVSFLSCIVLSFKAAGKEGNSSMKRSYRVLGVSCMVPMLFHLLGMTGLTGGYDPAPIGSAIGVMIFVLSVALRHAFDLAEAAHESILKNLEEAIVILDYRNGFQEANEKALELFPELAKTPRGDQVKSELLVEIIEEKGGTDISIGSKFFDAHFNDVVSNKIIIGHTIMFVDITEAKIQIDNMKRLSEAAEAANKAKSTFLASVSHEIRTPINVVVGMSDVIMRDCEDEKMRDYADKIQNAARTLLELINDILDFSKIESGKTDLVKGDYAVKRFLFDIINTYKRVGDEKGLRFETDIDEKIPATLFGDETRIRQIMTNVLSNAFKYTREGFVSLKAEFKWTGETTGNFILTVTDSGIGIKEEDLEKLFEIFIRLDEKINRAIEGTGLGLNITRQLIELMDGDIGVSSEYGKGTTFTITIPQDVHGNVKECIGDIKETKTTVSKRRKVGYSAPDANVLVVDDSRTNLIVAKALLRDTKVMLTTAASGFECIEFVKNKKFDVIFLDHRMPEMDGVETLHKMKDMDLLSNDTPVIMLTANAVNDAKEYYVGEGFTDFISKPICEETITGILYKYLPKDKIIDMV